MRVRSVPAARILVDSVETTRVVSEIGRLWAYDLTITTTVGPYAFDVRTSVLGHREPDTLGPRASLRL